MSALELIAEGNIGLQGAKQNLGIKSRREKEPFV